MRPQRRMCSKAGEETLKLDVKWTKKPQKPVKTALVAAVDMLARQSYSVAKIREKLTRKGYEEEAIQAAIDRLAEMHYLDDVSACQGQFACLYNESRSSVRQIFRKLMQRGFPKDIIRSCVPADTYEREKRAALRTLALKYKRSADKRKMMASLYRSGFRTDVCRAAVEAYAEGAEEDEAY